MVGELARGVLRRGRASPSRTSALPILAPYPQGSFEVLVFIFVLVACGYSLWRVWRREHTYGY